MKALAAIITIAGCFWGQYSGQVSFAQGTQVSSDLEKRAVPETQRILAQELDSELPRLPFANWLKQVVGPQAGIVWQLSECGEAAGASLNPAGDMRACVEANSILPDGRKVIVMIVVGTFKKGMAGAPAFHFGVVAQEDKLRPVRRLRYLPREISEPGSLPVELPNVQSPKVAPISDNAPSALPKGWDAGVPGLDTTSEDPPPEPPQARLASTEEVQDNTEGLKVLGEVSWGGVISKVRARYPLAAKKLRLKGNIDVHVTISATGQVTAAKATNGPLILRAAAEEAASQWVFKPSTLKGDPVETEIVLTFEFKAPE
jgi:TonB family protein